MDCPSTVKVSSPCIQLPSPFFSVWVTLLPLATKPSLSPYRRWKFWRGSDPTAVSHQPTSNFSAAMSVW